MPKEPEPSKVRPSVERPAEDRQAEQELAEKRRAMREAYDAFDDPAAFPDDPTYEREQAQQAKADSSP